MDSLKLRFFPDQILRQPTVEVTKFDKNLHTLIDQMRDTMYAEDGIGLAAPQVGVSKRVAVIDTSRDGSNYLELVNPLITLSDEKVTSEEGCLSIPGYREKIMRSESVTIKALDRDGKPFSLTADGLLGICAQHEIDHLNGILFIDYLTGLKKQMFQTWLKKQGTLEKS